MKFRAKLDRENVNIFYQIVSAFEKVGESIAILLSEDKIRFALVTINNETPKCFSELNCDKSFIEYRIESQSDNNILMELNLHHLSKALGSGRNSQCILKLVKRDSKPFLYFETKASVSSTSIDIMHDIPIRFHKTSDIVYYLPPDVPAPNVALEIPKGKLIRSVLDKMGKFAKQVDIAVYQSRGTRGGCITFQVDHSSAIIKTMFYSLASVEHENVHPNNKASVKVDIRKLSAVLNIGALPNVQASMYVTDNASIVIHLLLPDNIGTITYYVPVVLSDNDNNYDNDG